MLLQPLLENAFACGSPPADGPLEVTVRSTVPDGWLEVEVTLRAGHLRDRTPRE